MASTLAPICPRCGYDLSGVTATSADRCPRVGTCAECGHIFEWSRVYTFTEHPWLFEYHWRRQPLARVARTYLKGLRPWRFCDVEMTDPIHMGPVIVLALGFAAITFLALVTGTAIAAHLSGSVYAFGTVLVPGREPLGLYWIDVVLIAIAATGGALAVYLPGPLILLLGMPVTFALLPWTLRAARVRRGHLLRIWLYSTILPASLALVYGAAHVIALTGFPPGTAARLNPWSWAERIDLREHPFLWGLGVHLPGLVMSVLMALWVVLWWGCACRLYLRIEKTGRIVLALATMLLLAAVIAHLTLSLP